MKKFFTLAGALALTAATLPTYAQITLDGVIDGSELGGNGYTSLGQFTPLHIDTGGFGQFGLLQMYGAQVGGKLYIALAGTVEPSGNNFQIWLDVPGRTGVPAGTRLPDIAGPGTIFATLDTMKTYGRTVLEQDADAVIAVQGTGDIQAAVYTSATTAEAKSISGGAGVPSDGSVVDVPGSETTGVYALFTGTRVAYLAVPMSNITANPGAPGGGAGSYGMEFEFDLAAMGVTSSGTIRVMAAQVSGDGYWSSDVIPEVSGNGNNNLAFHPNFAALPGTQSAALNVVAGTARDAADAAVAMRVFPNPAQGQTAVAYRVSDKPQTVTVTVTDLLGRPVHTLLNAPQAPGLHELPIGADALATGLYLVRVQVGELAATRRLSVVR